MLVSFYRWLKGYLIIQIIGYSPERFLNLCKNKKIQIWKITPVQNAYNIRILLKNVYDLKSICKKTGVRIKVIKRCGFPFFIKDFMKRKLFLFGFILCFGFLIITRNCIWEMQISGNHVITEDVVMSYLKNRNIVPGVFKHKIDCNDLVNMLREEFDNIVWASVSIDGTKLCIAIKEKEDNIEFDSRKELNMDIIATCPGTVVKMITRSGIPMVSVGDYVKPGDTLVVGDADIWIETILPYEEEILSTYSYKKYEDKTNYEISFIFNHVRFKLKRKAQAHSLVETLSEEKHGFNISKKRTYNWTFDAYDEAEREKILNDKLERFCKELEVQNISVKEKNINITHYINKSISSGTIRLIYLHKIWYN